jgi:hypothetical protein
MSDAVFHATGSPAAGDPHLGAVRPAGVGYWPLPEDAPTAGVDRESVRLVSPDGALVRGLLWTPRARPWRTAVVLTHPRADFSVHYACPLLAAAGFAVFGFATRYLNNDIDCLHDKCVVDVSTAVAEMRRRGAEAVVLLGNSGGGSLMALAQAHERLGDGWIGIAAHPGEGVFMLQVIDPSVADENDPFATVDELDLYHPDNGWRPWPEPCHYDPAWVARYRAAQRDRVARVDAIARAALADQEASREQARSAERGSVAWRRARARGVTTRYLTIYRTLADPAYLDLDIDPDDRPMGSLFAFPDPFEANYGRAGLARVMTDRGWLSTWSGLSSHARLADTAAAVDVPALLVHPMADTEIRVRQAQEIFDNLAAPDKTFHRLPRAPHYLEGHRREAMDLVIAWLEARYPR